MFIVRHRDTPLDGTAPAFQYGFADACYMLWLLLTHIRIVMVDSITQLARVTPLRG